MNTAIIPASTIAFVDSFIVAARAAELAELAAEIMVVSDRTLAVLATAAEADALPIVRAEIARRAAR